MKIVLNKCYGGFGLSVEALKLIAERKNEDVYFFDTDFNDNKYIKLSEQEAKENTFFIAFTVSNPNDYNLSERGKDGTFKEANKRAEEISLPEFRDYDNRTDPDLIHAVETLGEDASGKFANLKIVEIPDEMNWEISDYDGVETLHEQHRSW